MYDALIMYRIRIMMKMLMLTDPNLLMLLVRGIMEFHCHGKTGAGIFIQSVMSIIHAKQTTPNTPIPTT